MVNHIGVLQVLDIDERYDIGLSVVFYTHMF